MSLLKVDSAFKRQFNVIHNRIFTACEYCFENAPFCHAKTNITMYLSIKDLEMFDELNFLQNLHLSTCTQIHVSVCVTSSRPLGAVGGKSPLRLSSQTHFAKIQDKNFIAKK